MNVAIVGCGYWGPNLVRNFVSLPQCERVVCCDTDPAKLERIGNIHPHATTTTSLQDILDDPSIEAVAIATPVRTHYQIAKSCLLAGKHVLVEKPLAASSHECRSLVRIAEDVGTTLMVAHTFEYSVALNKAKEIIDSGELGSIRYVSIQRLNLGPYRPDVDVLWDLATHDVSILLFLLEQQPVGVNAQAQAFLRSDHADVATAMIHFDSGVVAFLHDSWLDPHKVRRVTIVGSRKMLVYDDVSTTEKIRVFDKGIEAPSSYETYGDFHFSYRYGDITSPRIEEREPLKVQIEHFLECIQNGQVPRTDGHSGTRVVELLEAMTQSVQHKGGYVDLLTARGNGKRAPAESETLTAPPPPAH